MHDHGGDPLPDDYKFSYYKDKTFGDMKDFTQKDIEKLNDKLADLIAERHRRETVGPMPVPDGADGPGMAGGRGGSKSSGSAPSFGNTDQYSRDKSRQIARDKIKNHNRTGTTMKVHNYQRGIGTNTKINSYRTNSANNIYNTGNTTRFNQRRNIRN